MERKKEKIEQSLQAKRLSDRQRTKRELACKFMLLTLRAEIHEKGTVKKLFVVSLTTLRTFNDS